jgi:hypothetical protein
VTDQTIDLDHAPILQLCFNALLERELCNLLYLHGANPRHGLSNS